MPRLVLTAIKKREPTRRIALTGSPADNRAKIPLAFLRTGMVHVTTAKRSGKKEKQQ
jgi:hypothetical protein